MTKTLKSLLWLPLKHKTNLSSSDRLQITEERGSSYLIMHVFSCFFDPNVLIVLYHCIFH